MQTASYKTLTAGYLDALRPEENLTVSEWADKHRFLAKAASPESGRYKTSRTPYLKKIMDCLSTHNPYRMIIFKKSAQIGATEAGLNWIGYKIDISPASILMVNPTEKMVKKNSKMRIDPMIAATPRLRSKITQGNKRDSTNTIFQKSFPGGMMVCAGANSPSDLSSMPVEALFLDEVDRYPQSLEGEGSPIDIALARVSNYARHKVFIPSTPTVKGLSAIDAEYEKTDKQKYFVPCPHCGAYQHLEWSQVRWEGEDPIKSPDSAYYECLHCQGRIEDHHKRDMLAAGYWEATDPDKTSNDVIGFHCNALISPWYTYKKIVAKYLRAYKDANRMIAFTNTVLGECVEVKGDAPEWQALYDKQTDSYQRNTPPEAVCFLTMGVDIQGDRIELEIVGWGIGLRSWSIDYRILAGPTNEPEVWQQLAKVVDEIFIREDGLEMTILLTCVDSGNWPAQVYGFCKNYSGLKVVPTKGMSHTMYSAFGKPTAANRTAAGKDAGHVMLYPVGVSYLKTELYQWLKLNKDKGDDLGPDRYCHFTDYGTKHFQGLVAEEERITVDKKGIPKKEWHRVFTRNEPLDCRIYARAAASILGIERFSDADFDKIADSYVKRSEKPVKKAEKTNFLDNGYSIWH